MRIARELHDVVAHTLAVITVQAGVGRRLTARRPEKANAALESIETIGRTAQDELRVVLGLLRDEETGRPLAPAPRLADVKDLVETVRASGTPVELRMSGADRPALPGARAVRLPGHPGGADQRREARAGRPCGGRPGRLGQRGPPRGHDDGGPGERPPAPRADGGTGHGIAGMRERIAAFGGWLAAGPRPAAASGCRRGPGRGTV